MSVAPSILVRFQNIVQASTNAKTTASEMNDSLSQLKNDLANLKAIWEGPAAGDYKELQRQWDQALTDLNQILSEISTTLQQSADQYQQTEKSNQSAWQV